jgi:hypothetical protein
MIHTKMLGGRERARGRGYCILEAIFKPSNTEVGIFKVFWHKGSTNVQPLRTHLPIQLVSQTKPVVIQTMTPHSKGEHQMN